MTSATRWNLDPDRCFSPQPAVRARARALYEGVADLPLVCPHGHVPPQLLSDPDARLGNPAELFIIPDHYIFRMLYSRGVPLEDLGIRPKDGTRVETDGRTIWRRFAEHFHLFRGTPTGLWLKDELVGLFGVEEKLDGDSADRIYDHLEHRLAQDAYRPRALFERFNIETLCTTDAATDTLEPHRSLRAEGFPIRPTFRPDRLFAIAAPAWRDQLTSLEARTGSSIERVDAFVAAIEQRRAFFKEHGATATDHATLHPYADLLESDALDAIFSQALRGEATEEDAARFNGHMLVEMARMSREDGLTMQLHVGSLRNHNRPVYERFGIDMGADIPIATDWTRGLRPLLNRHGNDPEFTLILFTLDESTYARELAPLAGHYPALWLGAPWWYFDSVLAMERYLDAVVETAGMYNLAGFNDDTRAFASIPTRHDVWRRTSCNWLAGKVERGLVDVNDAPAMARWLAYDAPREAYGLSAS